MEMNYQILGGISTPQVMKRWTMTHPKFRWYCCDKGNWDWHWFQRFPEIHLLKITWMSNCLKSSIKGCWRGLTV